jgi:hypothetical protein
MSADRGKSNLIEMQITGKEIADIFVNALDPTKVLSVTRTLLDLTQSNLPTSHESRMMILGALAAAGQGATAHIVETGEAGLPAPGINESGQHTGE